MNHYFTFDRINNERILSFYSRKPLDFGGAALEAEGRKVNAKSIMGMMTLGLNTGETVKVLCDGDDEETAAENIENFLSGKMQSA